MCWHGSLLIKQLRGEGMLEDLERKILRILYNYFTIHRIFPTIKELQIKTGKKEGRIKHVLLELERKGYVSWEDKSTLDSIIILKAWEQESSHHATPSRGTEYWSSY